MSGAPPRFVVIGNPENRRVAFFQEALHRFSLPEARILSYEDLLTGRASLESALTPDTVLRIESPGENFAVESLLLKEGRDDAEAEGSPIAPDDLSFDRGQIVAPRQWYLGFCRVLRRWTGLLEAVPDVWVMNAPADIACMFDKVACHARCLEGGIAVPPALGPVQNYDELIARMDEAGWDRVFVKLAHGSSASGVVAFHRRGDEQSAITSAEIVRTGADIRLYNSLRIRRYEREADLRDLINALAAERVHVEQWLPKASLNQGESMDVRVVVIDGEPCHLVVRQGRSPMTNLHLGNRRGNVSEFLAQLGESRHGEFFETCRRTARLFRSTLYAGLDVLFTPGFRRHAVLEVNAFGDLLPGVTSTGWTTCEAEIAATLQRLVRAGLRLTRDSRIP